MKKNNDENVPATISQKIEKKLPSCMPFCPPMENLKKIESLECKNILKSVCSFVKDKNLLSHIRTEEKLIILVDIVDYSKSDSQTQFANIVIFQNYLRMFLFSNSFSFKKKIRIQNFVPTGDGCYMLADKCDAKTALDFLILMISGFESLKDYNDKSLSIRVSANFGDCIPFLDLANHQNFLGEGMNEASRILTYGQQALENQFLAEKFPEKTTLPAEIQSRELCAKDFSRNSLFLGDSLNSDIEFYADNAQGVYYLKNVVDKHGKTRNVTVLQGIKKMQAV